MKYFFVLFFITIMTSCYTQQLNQKRVLPTKQIDDTYKKSHQFGDCTQRLGFSRNSENRAWVYPGSNWKLAKISVKSFSEVNDSIIINANFKAMFEGVKYNGKTQRNMNIEIGDFVVAKHNSRVNDYYVFEFIHQIGELVKLDYKTYRIKSKGFSKLEDVEKIRYCIKNTDLRTLEELVKNENININICAKFDNIHLIPLSYAIENSRRKSFDKLLELGANVNEVCRENRTALMIASRQNDTYYFEKLIKNGADVSIKDENGRQVSDYIKYYGHFELLELIE